MCVKGEIKMTLIPRSVIDLSLGSLNTEQRKQYVLNFLETSLDENQISYFAYCINRLNAMRSIIAQRSKSHDEAIIDRDNIEVEEVSYTEKDIKSFIILQNSSMFSPIEYNQLYDRFVDKKKELKQVI